MKFKKKIIIHPAWDKRHPEPSKNYGIGSARMCFYLIGDKGVIQFILSTNWHTPEIEKEFDHQDIGCKYNHSFYKPQPYDIGYHSPAPMYDDQMKMESCDFFNDGCYYDGSSLQAEKYYDILRTKGTKGLWKAMKECYEYKFNNTKEHP